ncbi:hypothetical protein NP233_g3761 [Leucocoprinus birnbaumii]|uniref:RING-type domain-containing protein n=1 Tax=Leucocoprinus birnbaumii TaxID=56174 RepID=A0AAD5YY45_9AGAR|nr:hypothetical protein NP233_g3761 [Leucocoprinus birnbaumii]
MDRGQDELERFQNEITESLHRFLGQQVPEGVTLNQERTDSLLGALPAITEQELEKLGHKDSTCSICIQSFLAILAEEESASAMESPAFFSGELGVTRITKWIKTGKLTCPMCRKSLLEPGSEPEPQPWQGPDPGVEMHPIYDMFTIGGNADLERFLFGHASTGGQNPRRRSNSDGDNRRNDYSGMYS